MWLKIVQVNKTMRETYLVLSQNAPEKHTRQTRQNTTDQQTPWFCLIHHFLPFLSFSSLAYRAKTFFRCVNFRCLFVKSTAKRLLCLWEPLVPGRAKAPGSRRRPYVEGSSPARRLAQERRLGILKKKLVRMVDVKKDLIIILSHFFVP